VLVVASPVAAERCAPSDSALVLEKTGVVEGTVARPVAFQITSSRSADLVTMKSPPSTLRPWKVRS
jgi:hypothetical protein